MDRNGFDGDAIGLDHKPVVLLVLDQPDGAIVSYQVELATGSKAGNHMTLYSGEHTVAVLSEFSIGTGGFC